jgi:hypothetical protein
VPAAVLTYFKKIVIVEDFLLTGRKCPIVNTKEMSMGSNNQRARIGLRVDESFTRLRRLQCEPRYKRSGKAGDQLNVSSWQILLKNRSHLVAARDSLAGKRCSGG